MPHRHPGGGSLCRVASVSPVAAARGPRNAPERVSLGDRIQPLCFNDINQEQSAGCNPGAVTLAAGRGGRLGAASGGEGPVFGGVNLVSGLLRCYFCGDVGGYRYCLTVTLSVD